MIKVYFFNPFKEKEQICYIEEDTFVKSVNLMLDSNYTFIKTKLVNHFESLIVKLCLHKTNSIDDIMYHNYHYLV